MAKRKAGVNNIIYELDNEDVAISSEDESTQPKKKHSEIDPVTESSEKTEINNDCLPLCDIIDTSKDIHLNNQSSCNMSNGGKIDDSNCKQNNNPKFDDNSNDSDPCKKIVDDSNIILYDEDMQIDSPASNTDLGVVGCENRTPLVALRFKDTQLANRYKKKIKEFMLRLITLHGDDHLDASDADTDIELDIWPEDLIPDDDYEAKQSIQEDDNFFFIDTAPCNDVQAEIPEYSQVSSVICNSPEETVVSPKIIRRGPSCFNCDGAHALKDCTLPRDHVKIAEKRKSLSVRVGRYHIEDDQKYGHLMPGRISGDLRHALGLKRNELPLYIYKMRVLGYPPGWLEEARISHSGITMFDSTGSAILDPEEEDGEYCEPGSKDKFDIKKILDFPGFNIPASSRYVEEGHLYGVPPISEQDSKMAMLQALAPNAMKAYKRKKLTYFPSADRGSLQGQAEMDLDSGDETPVFPSVPPLPDETPPPPPPPPRSTPPETPPSTSKESPKRTHVVSHDDVITIDEENNDSKSDIEITDVMQVMDIPIPEEDLITLDEDNSILDSSQDSLTLDDLEKKKMLLLDALEGDNVAEAECIDVKEAKETEIGTPKNKVDETKSEDKNEEVIEKSKTDDVVENVDSIPDEVKEENGKHEVDLKTPDAKAGHVKTTSYGTPVVNSSPYSKLPSDDKFAKDISDIINFENLPNSIGKYKKISSLLKKVKTEVDRIQES